MGISNPIYGRVFADTLLEDPVDLSRFLQPRVEPELAVVLRDDLQPEASPGAAWLAVGAIVLAVDVLDSVWQDYRFDIADVVADNASGGGMLLGERALSYPLVGELRLYLDGELLTAGPVEELEPFAERLIWLAKEVGGLMAGQVIFLGSPAAALQARSGLLELQGPHGSTIVVRLQ
jgi:2-keto-4-pentenoate hydratase